MADGAKASDAARGVRTRSTGSIASVASGSLGDDSGRVLQGPGLAQVDVNGCSQGISDLFLAAVDGDIDRVKALCMAGADVDGEYCATGTSTRAAAHFDDFFEQVADVSECGADTEGASTRVVSTALHAAAYFGHVEIVRFLCEAGAKMGVADTDGLPALHLASSSVVAATLLGRASDVNRCYGPSNRTALHAAAKRGDAEVVRYLCDAGAEIDRADTMGMTALHLAAGHESGGEAVLALIDCGADLGSASSDGCTPLHEAARCGFTGLVKSLCTAGAEVDPVNDEGWTPLHMSMLRNDAIATAEALLSFGADTSRTCHSVNFTALHIASVRGQADLIRLLCGAGAEVERATPSGYTAVRLSMFYSSNAATLTALLESGADVNRREMPSERTYLHLAALEGRAESALVLCEAGAQVDQADVNGMTALHHAANKERPEVVRILLEHGANVNANGPDGSTPLRYAVETGNVETTRMLCAAGADTDPDSAEGHTFLHTAGMRNFGGVARVLLEYGANKDAKTSYDSTPVFTAVLHGHVTVAKVLCSAGANLETVCDFGLTALCMAARSGSEEMVYTLLDHGANVNVRDATEANTPLHIAVWHKRADVVRVLCAGGADTAIRNAGGTSPLGLAVLEFDLETVAALCEFGADVNAACNSNLSFPALMYSISQDRTDVARLLLQSGARHDMCFAGQLTALHVAADCNRHAIVEELLLAGADPEARLTGSGHFTPLHLACQKSQVESVLALLRGGANELAPAEGPRWFKHSGEVVLGAQGAVHHAPAAATAIDLIGFKNRTPDSDPDQRLEGETDDEFAARRDPVKIERIREALLQATRNRIWGRRGWLVVLKARFERSVCKGPAEGGAGVSSMRTVTGALHLLANVAHWRETGDDRAMLTRGNEEKGGGLEEEEEEEEADDEESLLGGTVDEAKGVLGKQKGGKIRAEASDKSPKRRDLKSRVVQEGAKLGRESGSKAAAGVIVAPGTDCSELDASMLGSAVGRDSCSVFGVDMSTVSLREVVERLLGLGRIEEGTFRHVLRFL